MKARCLSLGSDQGPHFEILQQAGFEVLPADRSLDLWDEQKLIEQLAGISAVIAGSEPYTRNVIEACPALRVIARAGVGFDAVDLETCDEQQIVVSTTPGVNHHSVAEHAIAFLMGLARGFPDVDQDVRAGRHTRIARPRVMGSTIGIVGLGRIGQAVATRAIGLGMNVLAFEPYPNNEFVEQWKIELVSLDNLLARSDYVSLHAPNTPETKHLMNSDSIAKMKPGAVLINTARGALIDERALVAALTSGHLRGAGLDVFESEPLSLDSPLLELPNVMLAGHLAGLDIESQRDTMIMGAETIVALKNGDWPAECIQNLKEIENWKWDT